MAGPRLTLLDEPAGGVNLTMLANLRERLAAVNREAGATFVVIEHNMEFVMALSSRILVLAEGAILALENVVAGYGKMTVLNGVTAQIRRGAIAAVIGPNGAGKSTLFKTGSGLVLEQGQTRIEDTARAILADPRIGALFPGGGLKPAAP